MTIYQETSICAIQVSAGSGFTGPSNNPAHALSWNYFLDLRGFITCSVPAMLASSCMTQFSNDTPDAGNDSWLKKLEQRILACCALQIGSFLESDQSPSRVLPYILQACKRHRWRAHWRPGCHRTRCKAKEAEGYGKAIGQGRAKGDQEGAVTKFCLGKGGCRAWDCFFLNIVVTF